MLFADVVLPVPLDQAFTYALPPGMSPRLGARVLAPWGRRRLEGVVVALHAELPAGVEAAKIKPLAALLDPEPLLGPAILELVRWTSAYYQAPIGEVMRCALPPPGAPRPRMRRHYQLKVSELSDRSGSGARLTPAQLLVIEHLRRSGGEAPASALRELASAATLATLTRRGWIAATDTASLRPACEPRARIERLNREQAAALAAIVATLPDAPAAPGAKADLSLLPTLLHGVTGSGKTAVYVEAIAAALGRGLGAILLVPEIGLTPALSADFEQAFPGQVAVLHSGLTPGERALQWQRAQSGQARVLIGTRSAVFVPVPGLGLIIVDEEHDASFKQQESPRYHARDLAVLRGKLQHAAVALGSATPSLESFTRAGQGKYRLVAMRERVEQRPLPLVRVVDMAEEFRRRSEGRPSGVVVPNGHAEGAPVPASDRNTPAPIFSSELLQALRTRLERRQQSLVLINRRGWAPVVLCRNCGLAMMCRDCELAMTYHRRRQRVLCHVCGFSAAPPERCAGCGGSHLYYVGAGSEQVEAELARLLPEARLARLDRDTARRRGHFEAVLREFRSGGLDILIGTQMIAKGHDVPGVTLVGVLQADGGLSFPDFRAAERTYQLLTQVAGRAGRGELPGEVILQVMHPTHYAVEAAARDDFAGFCAKEANFRRWMHYPPFASLALVQLRHRDLARLEPRVQALAAFLERRAGEFPRIKVLGPAPALIPRLKTEYRFQFLFKSASRGDLHLLLRAVRDFAQRQRLGPTDLVIDVDPLDL